MKAVAHTQHTASAVSPAEHYKLLAAYRLMEIQRLNKALTRRARQVRGMRIKMDRLERRKK